MPSIAIRLPLQDARPDFDEIIGRVANTADFELEDNVMDEDETGHSLIFKKFGCRGTLFRLNNGDLYILQAGPASFGDYAMVCELAHTVMEMYGSIPEFDIKMDGNLRPITEWSGPEMFSTEWISQMVVYDFNTMMAALMDGDMPIILECFNYPLAVGPNLLAEFGLYPLKEPSPALLKKYMEFTGYLAWAQWEFTDIPRTATGRCMVHPVIDPDEREALENNDITREDIMRFIQEEISEGVKKYTMSVLPMNIPEDPSATAKDADNDSGEEDDSDLKGMYPQMQPVRFLAAADFLSVFDIAESEQMAMVPFTMVHKLMADIPGKAVDELQYITNEPLNDSDIAGVLSSAPLYTPPSPFMVPSYPGMGAPEDGQRTFILRWNPAISSFKMDRFRKIIPRMQAAGLNWSVREYEKARMGDRFYMVCHGPRYPKGIVMSGIFTSNPYRDKDWNEERESTNIWYIDLKPNLMMDPRHPDLFTSDLLTDAIPGVNWFKGHSGELLSDEDAATLEELWAPQLAHARSLYIDNFATDKRINAVCPDNPQF